MAWLTAVNELRTELSDGPLDKMGYRKKVFGDQNSSNRAFKTFEYRRLTNLSTATAPFGVYVNGAFVAVSSDDLSVTGEFVIATAPAPTDLVEATYYYQWFLDSELTNFLTQATRWMGFGTDFTQLGDNAIPAVLKYSLYEAYTKLSLRYAQRISEIYRLEDAVDPKTIEIVKGYQEAAQNYLKDASAHRKDIYTRQDQPNAPLYGVVVGSIREVVPRR